MGQLVPTETTTNVTLKALYDFEDSEKLIKTKKKVNRRDRSKKWKGHGVRRMICDLQTRKNAGAKELIPMPALQWTEIWSLQPLSPTLRKLWVFILRPH